MKLFRYGPVGREKPGVVLADGRHVDASGACADYDEAFLGGDGVDRLRAWANNGGAGADEIDPGTRFGPPLCRPSKIICIGLNYSDHAAEAGMDLPREPVLFFKATTSLCGPNDDLVIPPDAQKVDWEVELAVVIGRRASYVDQDAALDHVAGYALLNDYSERAYQLEREGQWVKGKSCDTFAPLGPYLVTPDEVGDPGDLALWLDVNGRSRQRGHTSRMVFGVAHVVSYVSRFMTLLPGDVISTGTPPGVAMGADPPAYLRPGDVVELGIDKLGQSCQRAVASPAMSESVKG